MPPDRTIKPDPAIGPTVRDDHSPQRPEPSLADAPDNQARPVGTHDPASMHRREDDRQPTAHRQPTSN